MTTRVGMGFILFALGCTLCALPRVSAGQAPESLPQWSTFSSLMAPIPPQAHYARGAFEMGSTAEDVLRALTQCTQEALSQRCPDFSDEQPVRQIRLSAFALDTSEVSVAQYERCVQARRCEPIPYYRGARRFERPELPATLVRHADASAYCAFVGGTLPTEAQFERAARGILRRVYPWGNLYHSQAANHGKLAYSGVDSSDGSAELAPTLSYPQGATIEGVLNLAGNAAEWIQDRYMPYYSDTDVTDPGGPDSASGMLTRVARGGGYLSPKVLLRGAARDSAPPDERSANRGFRCAYTSKLTNLR